jgi:hypothetical protein
MRGLDIRSPRGKANEANTNVAWREIMKYYDFLGVTRQHLHDAHPADGILRCERTRKPVALIEVKSRSDFEEDFFWRVHKGTWLISNHKITDNIPIARGLGVPFIGAMHIVQSRTVLLKTIWEQGKIANGIDVRKTETQATINGGRKIIPNAFIPMHNAIKIRYDK